MSAENIYLAGRYNKYLRDLSQSPWIDKNDVRVKDSVQEMLEDGLRKFLSYEKSVFASSGREDVDVRMLGTGRPFTFKIINPREMEPYNRQTLDQIQDFINSKYAGKIGVRDLQIANKNDVTKFMKEGQETKRKEYRALCCCSRKISSNDIERINKLTELCIKQKTPIRVLHRRTLAVRCRTIHRLKMEPVHLGEFDSVREDNLEHVFALTMLTEAGTYIKEFVHGDFGRTEPNLSSLLKDCDTDLMELDVTEVQSDWPPTIDDKQLVIGDVQANPINTEDKMENSDEALAELYQKGYKRMQEALDSPRGDKRQDLLIECRRIFERSMQIVDSLALYSDNETLDDVATTNLRYLLLPAFLAKISISGEMDSRRLEAFTRAETFMNQFFHRISTYGLGDQRVERAIKSIDNNSSQLTTGQLTGSMSLEDQMRSRAEKIERLNKTRQLEEKLAEMERRTGSGQTVDEEVSRDYYISILHKWINETLEDYERIVQPGLTFERGDMRGGAGQIDQLDKPKAASSLEGKTFTIVKDELQKKAFGVGYPSLPTVSVDEFISKKIKDGDLAFQSQKEIYANSLQRYAEKPDLRREQEEQSDEERELKEERGDADELARKRAWDEFKDDTPRGSGNRHNMG